MENQLNCPGCDKEYHQSNPPRLLPACGHSFCQACIKEKVQARDDKFVVVCPEDSEEIILKNNDVATLPKNKALMKIIQSKKANSSFRDPCLEMSKIAKNDDLPHEDEQARSIVEAIILEKSVGEISEEKPNSEKEEETKVELHVETTIKQSPKKAEAICKAHQKPLEVVCIIDMKRICVNCAIFGEHKGHEFKSLEQIENERTGYYSSILQIMEKKNTIAQRLSNEQTYSSIMQILGNKKQKMKQTITQRFKKLTQSIQHKQKQSLKYLQSLIQKTQSKLKTLIKVDSQTVQKYDSWQQKSYEQIKILEGDDFQAKLHLIFSMNGEDADVLDQGDAIIAQLTRHQDNLFNQVQVVLDNIGVQFNLDIFNHIEGFVDIFDEVKKKKTKTRTSKVQSQTITTASPTNTNPPIRSNFSHKKQQQQTAQIKQQPVSPTMAPNPQKQQQPQSQFQFQYQSQSKQNQSQPQSLSLSHSHSQSQIQIQIQKIQILQPKPSNSSRSSLRSSSGSKEAHLHAEESLLEIQEDFGTKKPEFVKTEEIHIVPDTDIVLPSPLRKEHQILSPSGKMILSNNSATGGAQLSPRTAKEIKKDDSFSQDRIDKNKKRILKLKLPEKIQKIVDSMVNDQAELVDLTNAELGDATIALLSQFLHHSKTRTVKFIRNKLTDDVIPKILPFMKGIITLNLSQNFLTEKTLDTLIENRDSLVAIKSVILSQNKIMERKAKPKIDKLKSLDIVVSI